MNSLYPFVSVIIPHYNDADRLGHCLDRLENQTYPSDRYEIIVIDNGSDESPEGVTAVSHHSTLVFENKPGSYAARNYGISKAQGEIIAFTDSDCLPEPNWIEKGVQTINQNDAIGFIAGKVDVFPLDYDHPTIVEQYEILRAFPVEEFIERWHFGVTANIFTRLNVINDVGNFDETLKSNGDTDWCQRVYNAGYKPVYVDEACVKHPALYTLESIYHRAQRWAGGLHDRYAEDHPPVQYLVHSFPHDILPPVKKTWFLFQQRHLSLWTRIKLIGIEWMVNYAKTFERVRLIFGGHSRRC
ncbi:MAG: glycosyltransferase family 2 protein [Ardenticatenaceae bacterium]|nr:glycosyltransferase family 2 protein [Ardenticatenaceae bacterium]MCB9442681.1 glycosyltransferase family 2 protein [Ardenticatenaceae bacterium]